MQATAGALACLLSACAPKPDVVATGLALPPVAPALTEPIKAPLCELPLRIDFSPAELQASIDCWQASFNDAARRHASLAAAVRVREKAAASIGKRQ